MTCKRDISQVQLYVTFRILCFPHLVVVSKHISGICWYMASKSPPHSLNMFSVHTSCLALHRGAVSSVLTESVNIHCMRNSLLMLKMRWPQGHLKNCLIIHDSMIYDQTPLTMAGVQWSCRTSKCKVTLKNLKLFIWNVQSILVKSHDLPNTIKVSFAGQSWRKSQIEPIDIFYANKSHYQRHNNLIRYFSNPNMK